MLTLSTIFTDIKERISVIPLNEPVFIYIGVGTCAGLKNKEGILEPQNYHQYPPFLQDLKNKIAELNLFIVLIDPFQEQPPYLLADKGLLLNNNNNINNNNIDASACVTDRIAASAPTASAIAAHAATASAIAAHAAPAATASAIAAHAATASGIAVYSLLQSVYTDPYDCYGDSINITTDLRDINKYAMEENITLLYHDFTGRRNSVLAEYFDPELKNHLNHIVYGMSARQDHGCYFDLSEASSYFPWGRCLSVTPALAPGGVQVCCEMGGRSNQLTSINHSFIPPPPPSLPSDRKRNCLVQLFNIFHYIVNDSLNLIARDTHFYSSPVAVDVNTLINTQIEQVISTIKSDLINHMLSLLRVIFRLIVGDEQRAEINIDYCFNFIAKPYREEFLKLYNENKYLELYNKLIDYFSRYVGIAGKLKNHDLSGKEILQFIVYGDKPYEWYSNIKHFF